MTVADPGRTGSTDDTVEADARWADALTAAALLAVDPAGLGGALLRARAGAARTLWLAALRHGLPPGTPWRRMPQAIADDRLLGGLDLAATLQAGRPVAQRGLLAEADGGLVVAAMAERLSAGTVARIAAVLDTGQVRMERDGLAQQQPARIGLVALDEGAEDDEAASPVLADRLAFHLLLDDLPGHGPGPRPARLGGGDPDAAALDALLAVSAADVTEARARLPQVASGDGTAEALCRAAVALGIPSLRAPWLALRAARAAAALQGHDAVEPDDAALAARLVLGPRATRLPAPPEADPPADASTDTPPPPAPEPPADAAAPDDAPAPPPPEAQADEAPPPPPDPGQPLDEVVLEAALAAMPAGLLAQLKAGGLRRSAAPSAGRAGALQAGGARGRPLGARRGELRAGARLDLIATLRAAAPWQRLRQREAVASGMPPRRVQVRPEDFHISRRAQRRETTTLFVVDASGSAALHRLAEAKGAVELLLADCYVRRDRVALLAFRGSGAELVLPPTRSLVRAKRALAGLPGGGGTPLAQALDAAADLAEALLQRGGTPVLVLLSDARANIARDGQPGRSQAMADALASARRLRALGLGMLMVDTAPGRSGAGSRTANATANPGGRDDGPPPARSLADALGALYLPLPSVDAQRLSQAARALAGPAR